MAKRIEINEIELKDQMNLLVKYLDDVIVSYRIELDTINFDVMFVDN